MNAPDNLREQLAELLEEYGLENWTLKDEFIGLVEAICQEIAREALTAKVEQNKSLCGCPMCSYHSEAFELTQPDTKQDRGVEK